MFVKFIPNKQFRTVRNKNKKVLKVLLPELRWQYLLNKQAQQMLIAPEMVHAAFFLEAEDKPTAKDGSEASPRFVVRCLCFHFHSLSTGVWEWVGSYLPSQHSPDISHSQDLNEEKCRLTRSCRTLEASLGASWCVEKQNLIQSQELTHSDISAFLLTLSKLSKFVSG